MNQQIDTISLENLLWFRIRQDINFALKTFSKDIHFTISNHPGSPDINFHLSRNNDGTTRKPSIRIAEIDKKLFEEIAPFAAQIIGSSVVKSVDIKFLKKKNPDLVFVDVSRIEKSKGFKNRFFSALEPLCTTKNNKLYVKEGYIEALENFGETELQYCLDNIEISGRFLKNANFAALNNGASSICFHRIKGKWYCSKQEVTMKDLLIRLVGNDLAEHFINYVMLSIEKLMNATTYEDVANFDKPIRLKKRTA